MSTETSDHFKIGKALEQGGDSWKLLDQVPQVIGVLHHLVLHPHLAFSGGSVTERYRKQLSQQIHTEKRTVTRCNKRTHYAWHKNRTKIVEVCTGSNLTSKGKTSQNIVYALKHVETYKNMTKWSTDANGFNGIVNLVWIYWKITVMSLVMSS